MCCNNGAVSFNRAVMLFGTGQMQDLFLTRLSFQKARMQQGESVDEIQQRSKHFKPAVVSVFLKALFPLA